MQTALAMKKELTVQVDEEVIDQAAAHAEARGLSLDDLVTRYLTSLASTPVHDEPDDELPPITRRLADRSPAADVDEEDYYRYLEKKHQ